MKKIIFILLMMLSFANAQDLTIESISGGVVITKTSNSTSYYYSDNSQLFGTIDNDDKFRIYTKLGAQVLGAYDFTNIEINDSLYTTKAYFVAAINNIPAFNPNGSGGGNFAVYCGGTYPIDSGEVIGDYFYIFSGADTVIVDVSSLAGGGGDSLWTNSNGYYEPINDEAFRYEFDSVTLFNDSTLTPFRAAGVSVINPRYMAYINGAFDLDNGAGHNLGSIAIDTAGAPQGLLLNPNEGAINVISNNVITQSTDTLYTISQSQVRLTVEGGYPKATSLDLEREKFGLSTYDTLGLYEYGFTGYKNFESADHYCFDVTNELDVSGFFTKRESLFFHHMYNVTSGTDYIKHTATVDNNGYSFKYAEGFGSEIGIDTEFKIDSNGITVPKMASNPSGVEGAIYYNTTDNAVKIDAGGGYQNVCTFSSGSGTPIGSVTPLSLGLIYLDTSANHVYISIGLTNSDWTKIN